jgi:hypothetical protein
MLPSAAVLVSSAVWATLILPSAVVLQLPYQPIPVAADVGNTRLAKLERENLEQQLEYLRYQISPHLVLSEQKRGSLSDASFLFYDGFTLVAQCRDESA